MKKDGFNIRIDELIDQYEKLDKEYMDYLEADMNKEARRINNKMHKISKEISELREKQEYGLKEDMKRKIELCKKFIKSKGLVNEFDRFIQKEESNFFENREEEEL